MPRLRPRARTGRRPYPRLHRSLAGCWQLFGEVLAREFGDPAYFSVHQLTVDAYAAQHPGEPSRRAARSVALHLITIGLFVDGKSGPADGPHLHRRLANDGDYEWLEPPANRGEVTVRDILAAMTPAEHAAAVERWARSVWDAWAVHQDQLRAWTELGLRD